MKFNRLQASISNNADQSPSLYMALCAVESLFADLEDNCGSDISRCPVGDERLPSKLVWLCRIINEIYQDNSEELQRNRSRLDAAMDKLTHTRKQLEESSAVAERLASLKAEYAALDRQLQNSNAAAQEYEALADKCRLARQKLETLSTFDLSATEAELKKLTAEIVARESAKTALLEQLEQADASLDSLQLEVDGLQSKKQSLHQQVVALQAQNQQIQSENAQLRDELNRRESTLAACKEEKQRLIVQRDEAGETIDTLREQINHFREEDLATKLAELEVVQKEMAQLEESQAAFVLDCDRIKEQRNQLILDIAHTKAENESLNEKLVLAKENRDGLEKKKICLTADLTDCLQELETLQSTVDDLTNIKLPEAQELHNQELLRKAELEQSVQQAEAQLVTLEEETKKLNECLPKLEEEIKNNRIVYDALTASCAARSTELENLERQIAELRSNTDEQKLMIYRKQLEETQQALENIQLECEQIQLENTQLGEKLEAMQSERARLRDLKTRHEQGVSVTEKQLQELEFVTDGKYMSEVTALEARVKLLETVRGKLAVSIANMQKVLGRTPVEESISLEDQLKQDLRELHLRVDDLRHALVECAKSLKLEER